MKIEDTTRFHLCGNARSRRECRVVEVESRRLPSQLFCARLAPALSFAVHWFAFMRRRRPLYRRCANAGSRRPRVRIWTTDQGLPQGSVNAIAQTPDGYLWIATFDGLVRFDGVRMQVYLKSEIPEMTSNRCLSLLVDSRGALWVGTEDGGIMRIHGTEVRAFGRSNQVASGQIGYFAEDKDGRVLAEVPGGIAVFEGGQWRLTEEKALPRVALSIPLDKPLPEPPGESPGSPQISP